MAKTTPNTPEERAAKRAKDASDVMWHIAAFVIVNAFLWFIDIQGGGGHWAYWTTIGWGVGLAFHIASYLIDDGRSNRRYQKYLAEERRWEEREGTGQ